MTKSCEGVPACGKQETTEAISKKLTSQRLPRLRAETVVRNFSRISDSTACRPAHFGRSMKERGIADSASGGERVRVRGEAPRVNGECVCIGFNAERGWMERYEQGLRVG